MDETPTAVTPPRTRAVRPRHAASLVVVRKGTSGAEVLMGLRGARHRFMPNRLVFPGGAVDRADYRARIASPLQKHVLGHLTRAATPRLAMALAVAAARELEEETGLSLGAPPRLEPLDFLCRAVTPPGLPIRFNARFFVVDANDVAGTIGGSGELEELRFFALEEALALDLALATRFVLDQLQVWLGMSEAERQNRAHTALLEKLAIVAE